MSENKIIAKKKTDFRHPGGLNPSLGGLATTMSLKYSQAAGDNLLERTTESMEKQLGVPADKAHLVLCYSSLFLSSTLSGPRHGVNQREHEKTARSSR